MEIKKIKINKHQNINRFGMSYAPINSGETTFFIHEKGVVGLCFGSFWMNKIEVLIYFVKDGYQYIGGIKKFKSERSLALLISKFHKEIEKM